MNREPFSVDEWYHCFTRGIDKRDTFNGTVDYERFLSLLYLCNSDETLHRSDVRTRNLSKILMLERGTPLVGIGAFCLMKNHFHLLIKELSEGGISVFMQKVGIAYTMYFNKKYERGGNLFAKPFKSKHIPDDLYFQRAIQYIHCNPAEVFERGWKQGQVSNLSTLKKNMLLYPYSSFGAYQKSDHPLGKLLDPSVFELETQLSPKEMLQEAQAYYADSMSR